MVPVRPVSHCPIIQPAGLRNETKRVGNAGFPLRFNPDYDLFLYCQAILCPPLQLAAGFEAYLSITNRKQARQFMHTA